LFATLLAGCFYQPARFVDAPPVTHIADDAPIAAPKRVEPLEPVRASESYLRRPLIRGLTAARTPDARDVNALDDVPASSWFASPMALAPTRGAPRDPLTRLDVTPFALEAGYVVRDGAQRLYEAIDDDGDPARSRTTALYVASRLARALGYITPEVHLAFVGARRTALVAWPIGVDIGPTATEGLRRDDDNDRLPHEDRRTLRSLVGVLYWLGAERATEGLLRDTFLATDAGKGHVVHAVVDLSRALGARAPKTIDHDAVDGATAVNNLFTLGLGTPPVRPEPVPWTLAVAEVPGHEGTPRSRVPDPVTYRPKPPLEPFDRFLPADAYWIAKRILALPKPVIRDILAAGATSEEALRIERSLDLRARALALWATAHVTPCELASITPRALSLRDLARDLHLESAADRYLVRVLDEHGGVRVAEATIPAADVLVLPLPADLSYAVVELRAVRGAAIRPPMEAHVVVRDGAARLVGIAR
jgi:hypothetical protein